MAHVTEHAQAVVLEGFSPHPGSGRVIVVEFDRGARWRRALRALGQWWGVALLCVFIPVAHFALVPGFFLFAIYQFFQRLGTAAIGKGAQGTCPDCGVEQEFELAGRWRVPQLVSCRACRRGLRLTTR
jgi:hypothetical protein